MSPKSFSLLAGIIAVSFLNLVNGVSIVLDPKYHVSWELNEDKSEVTFDVVAETTGYVGLGFSSNGAMTKADIIIGGVKDGTPYFNDYHGPEEGNGMPIVDSKNDYKLISANENGTHTTLKFSRLTQTCDPEDMAITEAGLRLIWALGESDGITYHGNLNRNVRSIYILDPAIPNPDLSHLKYHDIISHIKMPADKTTYWCSIHRLPDLEPQEQQMIAYEPIFLSEASRNFTHHMNILKCFHGLAPDHPEYGYDGWENHPGTLCSDYTEAPGFPGDGCVFLEYGWALGGELAVNPPDVGFPFNSRQYYKLEVHLNNPGLVKDVEVDVGFRIYYTEKRQPIQGSLLMVSAPSSHLLMIPPNSTDFVTTAHCMPKCLNFPGFPKEGIKAYNAFLHAHTSARKMIIRHYRDGVELPWIINDENYDFNYQTNRRLPQEVTIMAGDQITAECVYDTHWNGGLGVLGGSSTDDEMCMVFIAYHPAVPDMIGCYDWMNKFNMFKMLGVETVDNPTGKNPRVTSPAHLAGQRFSEVVNTFNWTQERREHYQWQQQYGDHVTACISPRLNIVEGYYPTGKKYEPEPMCETNEKTNKGTGMTPTKFLGIVTAVYSLYRNFFQ